MSAFDSWFILQHGPRSRSSASDKDLQDHIDAGQSAADEMNRRALWDARKSSALYAWQVREKDKAAYQRAPATRETA